MQKTRFLATFEEGILSKGNQGMKTLTDFNKKLVHNDITEVAQHEDFQTPLQILESNGSSLKDFGTIDEAMAAVWHLVEKSQKEFEWTFEEYPCKMDAKFPQFSRIYYVMSKGKTSCWKQNQEKVMEQTFKVKNQQQLQDAAAFMEGLGFSPDAGPSSVQIVNEKFNELQKETKAASTSHLIYSQLAPSF